MAVQLHCGAIFLHVPKTGGSWVTRVLKDQGLVRREFGHIHSDMVRARYYASSLATLSRTSGAWFKSLLPRRLKRLSAAQRVRRQIEQNHAESFPYCFCFVRHPLSWYESWWGYMGARSGTDWRHEPDFQGWHPCGELRYCGAQDFAGFVHNVQTRLPGFVTELFGLYTQPGIRFIGKQERLTEDLIEVLRQLNVRFDEQRLREALPVNTSDVESRGTPWTPALRESTARLEFAGMVRYGYAKLDDDRELASQPASVPESGHA